MKGRGRLAAPSSHVTLNAALSFLFPAEPYVYLPALSVTVHVTRPRALTPVVLLTLGPLSVKLWLFERSLTTNV